ncbi:hypothetical protein PHET_09306 [Paragonimus heterotremus]|uniref:Uncharacterized protein n=1 Tax=Paragonimus heterotremus TaxID=100268 RepID=A0A8J4WUA9_9TREM|nr:hypothetical protein PHET_09306 [Paragonimus heterotremus]
MAANKGNTPQQNAVEEQLLQQIDKLQMVSRLLAFRACKSEESNRKAEAALRKVQQTKNQLKQQSSELVDDMEHVILSIVTSLKAFQAEARATLFSLQTQLQNSEKELQDANVTIRQLTEKVEFLEQTVAENKRLFEVNLQAIHVTYINVLESVFEKLQEYMLKDLSSLESINDELHARYAAAFKQLGLQCTFHDI